MNLEGVSARDINCYAAYEWFKQMDRFGVITKAHLSGKYRNRNNYWLKKLLSIGWMYREKDHYRMKGQHEVWRILGVKPCKKANGKYGFKYIKLVVDSDDTFLKDVKDGIFKHLVKRRKNQIAYRLASGRHSKRNEILKKGTRVELSGTCAAKLFGYKSFTSGLKYRNKYFKVTRGKKIKFLDEQGYLRYGYECGRVSLY